MGLWDSTAKRVGENREKTRVLSEKGDDNWERSQTSEVSIARLTSRVDSASRGRKSQSRSRDIDRR